MRRAILWAGAGVAILLMGGSCPPTRGAGGDKAAAVIEPDVFRLYEQVGFRIRIRPGRELKSGAMIECQLPNSFTNDQVSPSKVKRWQTTDPAQPHHIAVSASPPATATFASKVIPREWVGGPKCPTRHGRCLVATLTSGAIPGDGEVVVEYRNTTSPWLANQKPGATANEGLVWVRVDGREVEKLPSFRVLPGPASYRRLIVPSSARPGEKFRALLVSLDKYNNLSASAYENVAVTLGEKVLAGGISYTGRAEVEVSIDAEGVHRLTADGIVSNPIRITGSPGGPLWGDIHFHDFISVDAMGNTPYEYARDVSGLDFAATAEHSAIGLDEHWRQTQEWCRAHYAPGRFVTLLGFEVNLGWHHNAYLWQDNAEIPPSLKDGGSRLPLKEMLDFLHRYKAITQIHHTGWGFDMRLRYPDACRLIEVYSMHGLSELRDVDNSLSFENQRHRPNSRVGPFYCRDAWALGQRFYTHSSSDNHFGQPGVRYNGVTAVLTGDLTREGILRALSTGRCYGTTGERMLLDFDVNGRPMGSELAASPGQTLTFRVAAHGTGELAEVKVFGCEFIEGDSTVPVGKSRFSKVDQAAVEKARDSWTTAFESKDLSGADFEGKWTAPYDGKRRVYYVRVRQKEPIVLPAPLEGHPIVQKRTVTAWSSPVWIMPKD